MDDALVNGNGAVANGNGQSADDEEIELTPEQVVAELVQAWRNECFSPELLVHRFDIVDCVIDQLNAMSDNLQSSKSKNSLKNRIHQLEVDRIRYILCAYLRARLDKIESFVHHYLEHNQVGDEDRLSDEEKLYAKDYERIVNEHLQSTVLKQMPAGQTTVDFTQIGNKPKLEHAFVFARALRACECILPDDQMVDMDINEYHLLPFNVIRNLLHAKTVVLE